MRNTIFVHPEILFMEKASEHFNNRENSYDRLIEGIVPQYRLFFGRAAGLVPPGRSSVLELGSGTGYFTGMILEKNPLAEITCIDMTPAMVDVARAKEGLKAVSFIEGDFRSVWPEEKEFDVVASTLCLHHLPDGDRRDTISKALESLRPGGVFINGDVFRPADGRIEEYLEERWSGDMIAAGLPEEEARAMVGKRRAALEFIDTPEGFMEKLLSAGFKSAFCFFSCDFYGVWAAYR